MRTEPWLNLLRKKVPDHVPGPNQQFSLQFTREMTHNPIAYLSQMRKEYGDVVRLPFPLMRIYLVSDPDLIGRLLLNTGKNIGKSIGYHRIKLLLGEGLLTSSGDLWRSQRRLATPAFHQKAVHGFFDMIQEESLKLVEDLAQRIKQNPVINISEEMAKLTFTIIVRILFTMNLRNKSQVVQSSLTELQHYTNHLFYSVFTTPLSLPTPGNRRVKSAIKELDDIVYQLIDEHQAHPDRYHDLLSLYLASRDEETGEAMSRQLLRDEVITLMLAGHETTAVSLSFAFELLARHPRPAEILEQEHARLPNPSLSLEDLGRLEYTNQVFSESMRLYPAAWTVGREATEDLEYGSYRFSKGSTFLCTQYLTHRNPGYWTDPEGFRPERFSPEESKGRHPFAYFPFGGGARACIGSNLARMEAQIILATLFRHFKMTPVKGHSYKVHPRITLVVDPGITLHLSRR